MKITVGSIIFNSESTLGEDLFVEWIKKTYEIADEFIIVEGATKTNGNRDGFTEWATKDGKSTDRTVEIVNNFPDPKNKIKLVTKNGFWNGKTEMCNKWAETMTGDYIWQIDSDEFYLEKDIFEIKKMINTYEPDAIHFYANHFWGDFNHCLDEHSGKNWANEIPWMRIFKHRSGSRWISHEPPNYIHPDGICCNKKNVISREETLKSGIKMFHYSCVRKTQIDFKAKFFNNPVYQILWDKWLMDKKTKLINGSWAIEFSGEQPINRRFLDNEK